MSTVRKIDAMYARFGRRGAGKCGDCKHYSRYKYKDKNYRKCEVYGVTKSEATDWAAKYAACGLYNEPYSGPEIIDVLRYGPRKKTADSTPIDGQMEMF